MRKNDLIKLLQDIKGNPEIMLWNGYVEDVVPINKSIQESSMFKMTFEGYKDRVNIERKVRDNLPEYSDEEVKKMYNQYKIGAWKFYAYYAPEKGDDWYKEKRILVISPKITGKQAFDRLGNINY